MAWLRRFAGLALRRFTGSQPAQAPQSQAEQASSGLPSFGEMIRVDIEQWDAARGQAGRKRVLIATSTGEHHPMVLVEGMLSAALTMRGAEPHALLCDGCLPACTVCDIYRYPDIQCFLETGPQADRCQPCFDEALAMYKSLELPVHRYSEYLEPADYEDAASTIARLSLSELKTYVEDGVSIGEHAHAGALRFFATGDLSMDAGGEAVLRKYAEAAILSSRVAERVRADVQPEVAVFHHGIYVPMGLLGDVMRRDSVRVVNWAIAYRKKCFIFSHGDTYHHTMMQEPPGLWTNMQWGDAQEAIILNYLRERWHGTSDWILVQENAEMDADRISNEIGIDFSIPTIALLTNVVWDAQLFYESNAFPDMLEWIRSTIGYFATRGDLQLVVRVHPAEVTGTLKSRQLVADAINAAFPELPPNVFVVGPERKLSTYALAEQCDAAIIYGTKTGVELAAMGIPVIVAGEAWIRDKGITYDARSQDEYRRILDALPYGRRFDQRRLERARRYAFHFFMRRMIPVDFMNPVDGWPPFMVAVPGVSHLAEGADKGLDVICSGILSGTPFVYPAEELLPSP